MNSQQAAALAAQMNTAIKTWTAHPASPSDMLGSVMQWRAEMTRAGVAAKAANIKAGDISAAISLMQRAEDHAPATVPRDSDSVKSEAQTLIMLLNRVAADPSLPMGLLEQVRPIIGALKKAASNGMPMDLADAIQLIRHVHRNMVAWQQKNSGKAAKDQRRGTTNQMANYNDPQIGGALDLAKRLLGEIGSNNIDPQHLVQLNERLNGLKQTHPALRKAANAVDNLSVIVRVPGSRYMPNDLRHYEGVIRLCIGSLRAEDASAGKAANIKAGISSGLAGIILNRLGELLRETQTLEHKPLHAIQGSTHQLILKFHQLAMAAQNEPTLDRAILNVVTALEDQPGNSGDIDAVVRQIMAAQRVASQLERGDQVQKAAGDPLGFSTRDMVEKYLEMLGQVERYVNGHGDAAEYAGATTRQAKNLKDRSLVAISQAIEEKVRQYQPLHIEDAYLPEPKRQIESLIQTAKRRAAQLQSGGKSAKAVDILGDAAGLLDLAQQTLESSGRSGFGAAKALPITDVMGTLREAAALITESAKPEAALPTIKALGFAGVPTGDDDGDS